MKKEVIKELLDLLIEQLSSIEDFDDKVEIINFIRKELHNASPFKKEPVDCVLWVNTDNVHANSFNPNRVASVEMELLRTSVNADGFTQPIVSMLEENDRREIVDGYHRNLLTKEDKDIRARLHGYAPVVTINDDVTEKAQRIVSCVRHNRARGTHSIELMSNIVGELVEAGMSDGWIKKHIGMDSDELLRLKQITGLASLFQNVDFSKAWNENETSNIELDETSIDDELDNEDE